MIEHENIMALLRKTLLTLNALYLGVVAYELAVGIAGKYTAGFTPRIIATIAFLAVYLTCWYGVRHWRVKVGQRQSAS